MSFLAIMVLTGVTMIGPAIFGLAHIGKTHPTSTPTPAAISTPSVRH